MNHIDFEAVYKEHYQKLYTLAFRMSGRKEDAEDILQTAFLNAFTAYDRFRQESSLYTWLYRIVLNAAKKYNRKSRRLPVQQYAEDHHLSQKEAYDHINRFGQAADETLVGRTRETCLQLFMNCMPSKYRAVYTLRTILDFPVRETAEILEIKENTVKVNLHRAKKIIKSHMDDRCSLIKPGSPCNCRSYAAYLIASQNAGALPDVEVIRNKERAATDEFSAEISAVFDHLYDTHVRPLEYTEFLLRVKQLKKDRSLKILAY